MSVTYTDLKDMYFITMHIHLKDWSLKDSSNLLLMEIFQNTSVSRLISGVSRSPYHYSR